jgi:hypothetical protein
MFTNDTTMFTDDTIMFTGGTYDKAEHKTSSDLTAAKVFKFQQNKTSKKRQILQRFHGSLPSSKCNATISSKEIAFLIQTNSTYSYMERKPFQ